LKNLVASASQVFFLSYIYTHTDIDTHTRMMIILGSERERKNIQTVTY